MKTIYKYPLSLADEQTLLLPKDAQILSVQFQDAAIYLWALVETLNEKQERRIRIVGTGHPLTGESNYGYEFIATVQLHSFVWHVFEAKKVAVQND